MLKATERRFRCKKFDAEHNLRRKQTEWYSFAVANNMIEFGQQNKADKEKKINENFSHTLLAGGILNVPIERQMQLLLALSKDISNNYVPDFNEISPPITRLYMDLDFKDKLEQGGLQLFYPRTITEMNNGNGTENFPAIIVEEQGLERKRYDNILVADCIAAKVTEYFPMVDPSSNFFHVHCMWRPSRFKYRENNFINANGKHVRETVVAERSFGFHLVWPNLHVTHAQALDIREGVIRALASKFYSKNTPNNRSRPGTNAWQEVVDEKIYLPLQSLRMVLSDKYETCQDCVGRNLRIHGTKMAPKRRKIDESDAKSNDNNIAFEDPLNDFRSHCPCHGSGKIPVNSIYKYEATVSGDHKELTEGFKREFQRDVFQMLVQCSIRDPHRPDLVRNNCFAPSDPIMVLPSDAPRYKGFKPSPKDSLSSNEKKLEHYKKQIETPASSTKTYVGTKEDEELSIDSREFFAVQNLFINAASVTEQAKRETGAGVEVLNFSVYAKVIVHRLRRCCLNGNYYYLVDVTDSGDRNDANFCFNINRIHTCVKNVFFKITPKIGIVQRCNCFSTKRKISCQNYQSPPCSLPKDCYDILFPTELLQKAIDANQASIVATTLRRSKSVLELSRDKIESEIEKPFVAIALDKNDAETIRKFASQNQPTTDDGTMCSSQSPYDIVMDQKYQLLYKKNDIIELSSIEKEAISETKAAENLHQVEAILEKCKRAETNSTQTCEKSVTTKLLDAFQDTFSVAYQNE